MTNDLYYDPWHVDIDIDPYPTYRRLRDETAGVRERAPRLLGSEPVTTMSMQALEGGRSG